MHPLSRWMEENFVAQEALLAELNAQGARTREGTELSPRWLRELLGGWRRPIYEVAKIIAEVTARLGKQGRGVSVDELRSYQRPVLLVDGAPVGGGERMGGRRPRSRRGRPPRRMLAAA